MKDALSKAALRWLPALVPWTVLVAGLAATGALTRSMHREMSLRDRERLRQEVDQVVTQFEIRLRTYCQALQQMKDWYFEHQTNMAERLWRNYVLSMHLPQNYAGLYNVGFVESVYDSNVPHSFWVRDAHLRRMRQRLGPAYDIHPPEGIGTNMWYHMPVVWHSYAQWRKDPARPYRHYGMDLNEDQDLWAAMNWALGQDVPALSAKQRLDPDDPAITGLMLFAPVYRQRFEWNAEVPDHIPGRLAHLSGLVFGGIEMGSFLKDQLGTNAPPISFALYASTDPEPSEAEEQLLFDNRVRRPESPNNTGGRPGSAAVAEREVRDLRIYGRNLRFVAEQGPAFAKTFNPATLGWTASFGAATTLLLSGFLAYQARAHRKERAISAALRQSETRLQMLLHERERMSRDLHDGTIQSLYAIGLGLGRLKRSLHGTADKERLDGSLAELDHVVAELRSYLVVLDPGVSPAQSAATALTELVARLRQTTATELRFTAEPGTGEGWPPAAVLDLLQAAREGVSNALRHGQATQVDLALRAFPEGQAQLIISDNGNGFDPSAKPANGSYGLVNLARRAQAWSGSLTIHSRPGGPTQLILSIYPGASERHL